MNSAHDNDLSSPSCDTAVAWQIRAQEGELGAHEQTQLAAHLARCATCRDLCSELTQLADSLQAAYARSTPSSSFVQQTMARVQAPAQPHEVARVFSTQSRWSFWTTWKVAAAVMLGLLGSAAALVLINEQPALAVSVQTGVVTDAQGSAVHALRPGQVYQVKETSVLQVAPETAIKAQAGAQFALAVAAEVSAEMRLDSGDVYATTKRAQRPLRVACTHFDTDLHQGDFFVAHEHTDVQEGVIVVFDGVAQVRTQTRASVAVLPGQVFVSVHSGEDSFSDTFELRDVRRLEHTRVEARGDLKAAAEYRARVRAYKAEAAELQKRLSQSEAGSPQHHELQDRHRRISSYLEAHQRKLETLAPEQSPRRLPLEQIKRAVDGHTAPASWTGNQL